MKTQFLEIEECIPLKKDYSSFILSTTCGRYFKFNFGAVHSSWRNILKRIKHPDARLIIWDSRSSRYRGPRMTIGSRLTKRSAGGFFSNPLWEKSIDDLQDLPEIVLDAML